MWRTRLVFSTFFQYLSLSFLRSCRNVYFLTSPLHDHFVNSKRTFYYSSVGCPCITLNPELYQQLTSSQIEEKYKNLSPLVIFFCPSGSYKGTPHILDCLSKIKTVYGDAVTVQCPSSGIPNTEVLEMMSSAHLVIDETNSDSLFTSTVCEAVYLGSYVLTCGNFFSN